ncbi:MAG: DmsC/YnfH family molybdoenzyme membrane anchor subunit [Thermoanaerobaculia bacterium]
MRTAFVFDPQRCTGCEACRVACGIENGGGRDTGWRTITTFNPEHYPALPTQHLSLACNHCDVPACALGCPANAYHRDDATGAVILDPEKCIGCRYCSWLCPYDAPTFDTSAGVMGKCTFCAPRLSEGLQPACAQACPTGALSTGEKLADLEPRFTGLGVFGLGPSLTIVDRPAPAGPATFGGESADEAPRRPRPTRKITARSEWALLLFTVVMPALVAWIGASVIRPSIAPPPVVFLGLAVLAMTASTLHLGKPMRAWRAMLNVRTSWLSREIAFANLFVAASAALLVPGLRELVGWGALVAGLALAISIDQVYRAIPLASRDAAAPLRIHSADAILTVVFLIGIATSNLLVALPLAIVKGVLFAVRMMGPRPFDAPATPLPVSLARVLLLAASTGPILPWQVAAALALAGEAIDRILFYRELEPTSPSRRMAEQLLETSREISPKASTAAAAIAATTIR